MYNTLLSTNTLKLPLPFSNNVPKYNWKTRNKMNLWKTTTHTYNIICITKKNTSPKSMPLCTYIVKISLYKWVQRPLFQITVVVLSFANKINLEHVHLLISTIRSFECKTETGRCSRKNNLWDYGRNKFTHIHVGTQTLTFTLILISSQLYIFDYLQLLTINSEQAFHPAPFLLFRAGL